MRPIILSVAAVALGLFFASESFGHGPPGPDKAPGGYGGSGKAPGGSGYAPPGVGKPPILCQPRWFPPVWCPPPGFPFPMPRNGGCNGQPRPDDPRNDEEQGQNDVEGQGGGGEVQGGGAGERGGEVQGPEGGDVERGQPAVRAIRMPANLRPVPKPAKPANGAALRKPANPGNVPANPGIVPAKRVNPIRLPNSPPPRG
jgi:hypothetical protein